MRHFIKAVTLFIGLRAKVNLSDLQMVTPDIAQILLGIEPRHQSCLSTLEFLKAHNQNILHGGKTQLH